MDSKYNEIYARLYDYPFFPDYPPHFIYLFEREFSTWDARKRRKWIDMHMSLRTTIDRSGDVLREDAKAFLFMNMSYMVILPVIIAGDEEARQAIDSQMSEDIQTLIGEARERTGNEQPVSAHAIIDALSNSWNRLKTMELRVWGASNEQKGYENG